MAHATDSLPLESISEDVQLSSDTVYRTRSPPSLSLRNTAARAPSFRHDDGPPGLQTPRSPNLSPDPVDNPFEPYVLHIDHEQMPSDSSTGTRDSQMTQTESASDASILAYHRRIFQSHVENNESVRADPRPLDVALDLRMAVPDTRDPGYVLSKERMASLSEIDNAKFSWFHMKVCLIAGVGFFTDAYDIFSINIASTMLTYVYPDSLRSDLSGALKAAAPIGTLVGQLLFGYLADRIGRKRMYGIELIIIIIGTFGQTLTANSDVGTVNIFAALVVWRIIMGLGVGGDYPLSAVIASEFASKHIRGRMMTAVFANQGWGQLAAGIVGTVLTVSYKTSDASALRANFDQAWRILIGLGCVPAVFALWFRLTIPETPRFTMDIERNVKQATEDIERFLLTGGYKFDPDSIVIRVISPQASWSDFRDYFSVWRNLKVLLGCAYSWFALDVVFYGLWINTGQFFVTFQNVPNSLASPPPPPDKVFTYFRNYCAANLFLVAFGLIPGYWATFLLIDYEAKKGKRKFQLGRKGIQLLGFGMLTILFIAIGASFSTLAAGAETDGVTILGLSHKQKVLLALFIMAGFFQNFGPNTTTFILPGETFPTRYRSTCHGLCAASGKAGAIMAQFMFSGNNHTKQILLSYVVFNVTGFLATLLIEETNQESLENLSNENQQNFILGPVRPPLGTFTALQHILPPPPPPPEAYSPDRRLFV